MQVAFFPYTNTSNFYVRIVQDAIRQQGFEIISLDQADSPECRAVILNWYEDIYNRNPIHGYQVFDKKRKCILKLKKQGKKIIYVFHDKKPHNSTMAVWAYLTKKFLVQQADRIVILCRETVQVMEQMHLLNKTTEKKIRFVPHPNYIGCYDKCKYAYTREKLGIDKNTIVLLHLGGIAKYKNNDLILDAAETVQNKDICFIIAGPAPHNKYTNKIKERIENLSNVIPLYGFVPDDEMGGLLKCCDALLVPHDVKSSLNSGTVFMAFSYAKTVICPEIGTIKDLPDNKFCFSYSYKNKGENRSKLIYMIEKFYDCYYNDRSELEKINEQAREYVKKEHSPEQLGREYKNIIFD